MNDSRISVSIDVSQSNSPVRVMCKQGDTGRVLNISLTDGGYPYVISKDCYAVFTAVKPDGKIICNPCQIVNGVIVYTFTAQTCACPGNMTAEIRLYGDDNKLLTSASFQMFVDKTVYRDGDPVVSDSEITVLTQLISETNALNQEIRDNLESGAFIGPIGPQGPQGVPGTVSFDELTDEQRESLRGGQGPQGETGKSGVYIGTEKPDDPDVNVWIDPDGDGDVIDEIAHQAAEILQPDLSQIKDDLSKKQNELTDADKQAITKLGMTSGSAWTGNEQVSARKKLGLGGAFELIEDLTLTEDVSAIQRNNYPDGGPFVATAIRVIFTIPANVACKANVSSYTDRYSGWCYWGDIGSASGSDYIKMAECKSVLINGMAFCLTYKINESYYSPMPAYLPSPSYTTNFYGNYFEYLRISGSIPAGTNIKIYAVRY